MKKTKMLLLDLTGDYRVVDGWRNTAGRLVNWKIVDPNGNKIATVTAKQDACRVVHLLNKAGVPHGT